MQNNSQLPEDFHSQLDDSGTSPDPYTETRQQCLDKCQTTYNQCIITPIAGETPAQRLARCQSEYTACCAICPPRSEC